MPIADVRFIRPGVSKVYFVPTIASLAAMTAAEAGAGTDLTPTISDVTGFSYKNAPVDTPDWSDNFVSKITGFDQAADSELKVYEKRTTNTGRTTLAKGVSGYLVIYFRGLAGSSPAAADKYDAWPVISAGTPREYGSGPTAAKWSAALIPTARPAEDAAVVA